MRISNKTKDKIVITVVLLAIAYLLSGLLYYIFADSQKRLTEVEKVGKAYNEQIIKQELNYIKMWEYTENMTDEEWNKVFMEEK